MGDNLRMKRLAVSGAIAALVAVASWASASNGEPDRSKSSSAANTHPAAIVGDPDPICPMQRLWPIRNGWSVSDEQTSTIVEAGASLADNTQGRFCILRLAGTGGKTKVVKVAGTGPLKITRGPKGRGAVQTWSQTRGRLHFTSKSGRTGVLRLRDDAVNLNG
jgi:hypothetical protein